MRSLRDHADAAFLSSAVSTLALQCAVWPALSAADVVAEQAVQTALAALAPRLPRALVNPMAIGEPDPQKTLTKALDRLAYDGKLLDPALPDHMKARLQLVSAPGADGFLHAWPNRELRMSMSSELFRISLARRLRLRLLDRRACCPCCGAALDAYLDHALVCGCGGDRTLRHNAARDTLYADAVEASMRAEREKAGLLPPRPGDESVKSDKLVRGRRPADVWLAAWRGGPPRGCRLRRDLGSTCRHAEHSSLRPGCGFWLLRRIQAAVSR